MSVAAYKFLDAAGRAPLTGYLWPIGEWVDAAVVDPCLDGIHACRAADVSHWIADSMWHIELDGDVVASRHKVAARRGRLLGPVDGYDDAIAGLHAACAWRSRDRAVAALRAVGDDRLADRFAATATVGALAALGADCDDESPSGVVAALAADCAQFAQHGLPAQAPFVAACSAGAAAVAVHGDDQAAYDAAYAAERAAQSRFLAAQLSLV